MQSIKWSKRVCHHFGLILGFEHSGGWWVDFLWETLNVIEVSAAGIFGLQRLCEQQVVQQSVMKVSFFTWCGKAGAQPDSPQLEKVHCAGWGLDSRKQNDHFIKENVTWLITFCGHEVCHSVLTPATLNKCLNISWSKYKIMSAFVKSCVYFIKRFKSNHETHELLPSVQEIEIVMQYFINANPDYF